MGERVRVRPGAFRPERVHERRYGRRMVRIEQHAERIARHRRPRSVHAGNDGW